jgi:hypothetical protein
MTMRASDRIPALLWVAALVFAGSVAPSVRAAEPRFESRYTDLAKDCRDAFDDNRAEEGEDMPLRCRGPAGASLYIYFSATDSYLQIEAAASDAQLAQALQLSDYDRGKVEWRMADGVPFAIIVRIRKGKGRAETLEVRGVGPHRAIVGSVPVAGRANANAEARAVADRGFAAQP